MTIILPPNSKRMAETSPIRLFDLEILEEFCDDFKKEIQSYINTGTLPDSKKLKEWEGWCNNQVLDIMQIVYQLEGYEKRQSKNG